MYCVSRSMGGRGGRERRKEDGTNERTNEGRLGRKDGRKRLKKKKKLLQLLAGLTIHYAISHFMVVSSHEGWSQKLSPGFSWWALHRGNQSRSTRCLPHCVPWAQGSWHFLYIVRNSIFNWRSLWLRGPRKSVTG